MAEFWTVSIDWWHSIAAGWCPHDFTTWEVFLIVARRTKQGRACSETEPQTRVGLSRLDKKDWMTATMEKIKEEPVYAAAEELRGRNGAANAKKERVNESLADDVLVTHDNVAHKNVSTSCGLENFVVVVEDSVASVERKTGGYNLFEL